jgi:ABC-2 type transport system permease protein
MSVVDAGRPIGTSTQGVPLQRLVKVELRKMFDTRSGFWLMASIGILALLATVGVILFAHDKDLGYGTFAAAVGFPMTILLPVVAVLAVTGEWSQRTGLITFTLVPHRGQVIWAKAIASVLVGVLSMVLAFTIGALGNLVGSAIAGVPTRWNMTVTAVLLIVLANVIGLLIGFMLGVLIRNSAGALVAYFVYSFVLPGIFAVLANTQHWFAQLRPWIDVNQAQGQLFDAPVSSQDWAHLGVSGLLWFVLPLAVGLWTVLRSEVK